MLHEGYFLHSPEYPSVLSLSPATPPGPAQHRFQSAQVSVSSAQVEADGISLLRDSPPSCLGSCSMFARKGGGIMAGGATLTNVRQKPVLRHLSLDPSKAPRGQTPVAGSGGQPSNASSVWPFLLSSFTPVSPSRSWDRFPNKLSVWQSWPQALLWRESRLSF